MNSLRNKILLEVFLLVFIVQAISFLISYYQTRSTIFGFLEIEAESTSIPILTQLADQTQKALSDQLGQEPDEGLVALFADWYSVEFQHIVQSKQFLDSMLLVDAQGKIISHNSSDLHGMKIKSEILDRINTQKNVITELTKQIEIIIPFYFKSHFSGAMIFNYNKSELIEKRSLALRTSIILMIIYIILGGIGALFLSRHFISRIRNMSNVVKEISDRLIPIKEVRKPAFKTNNRPTVNYNYEIGTLSRNLDLMCNLMLDKMESIEKQNESIDRQNRILEQKVKQNAYQLDKRTKLIQRDLRGMSNMMFSIVDSKTVSPVEDKYISIQENKKPKLISVKDISHITVEEHYLALYYKDHGQYKKWNTFGNLKDLEDRYSGVFIRINRSVIINPNMILELKIGNESFKVLMKGDPENTLIISKSKYKLIRELVESKRIDPQFVVTTDCGFLIL